MQEKDNFEQSKMDYGNEAKSESKEIANPELNENGNGDNNGSGVKGIIFKSVSEVLHDSMIPYTEHVVLDRALPRVEDGLKPVQRRILYTMLELGVTPDKPHRKSARIVGDCLGKYHPHGDSSVYDAMCRMAQDWVERVPLVDGHGNFGSVDGDSPAAMRYTEARLTPLAMEIMRDIEKDTVRWSLNFDDSLKEPDIMPGRFPNLLVNGATGIAVGVATNIPPHNLGEAIDGVVAYINNPNIKIEELMKIIKAPDFPSGGIIISQDDGLEQAYKTGKGKIIIRAKVVIEQNGDKSALIIKELPYQVNKAQLIQKIAELKETNKDKLSAITEIADESDRTTGMRGVIKLKKDSNPQKILEFLFKSTNLQISYGINMVAIADGKPKLLNLLDIVAYYAQYQREIIVRRTKYDLNIAKERAHIVEGLLIAIKNIDEVIKIIKKSATTTEAKQRLRDRFNLSEKQAQAILDMRLARLVHLEVDKLEEELKELKAKIKEYEEILGSKKLQYEVVKREILEIKKNYNTSRKTTIMSNSSIKLEQEKEEEEEAKNYVFAISAGGTIKKVTTKNYAMSQKTIGENTVVGDLAKQVETFTSLDEIMIFTNMGNVIKCKTKDIKECKWRDKGNSLLSIEKTVQLNEIPVAMCKVTDKGSILFMTKKGMVKKSEMKELLTTKSFYQVCKLNEDDEVISVEFDKKEKSILMLTREGMALNFEKSDVPTQGRISIGVRGMNIEDTDDVIFASQVDFTHVISVTENGYIKKMKVEQFPISQRYRKGLKYVTFSKGAKQVLFASSATGNVTLAVDFGLKILPLDTKKLPESERTAIGNEVIKKNFLSINKLLEL